ncbi:hypothetical protein MAR_035788 [Mya arenaria]|uniref:Uncharacterized protein n=1 Tax=Mya arenaria TaxID=6604 RepID=A0ABY7ENU7_MYAAR|nr:hypothetical protein MAR_035788 [Mya arenaria]
MKRETTVNTEFLIGRAPRALSGSMWSRVVRLASEAKVKNAEHGNGDQMNKVRPMMWIAIDTTIGMLTASVMSKRQVVDSIKPLEREHYATKRQAVI